jgi:acetyl-CoA C-acetyltransferase
MTINKVCGSGLKATMLGAQAIISGDADVVVCGGMENMSLAPHLMRNSRAGFKMGNVTLDDHMVLDGLWDVYNNFHMGNAAELCAKEKHYTREAQDQFAIQSYKRAQAAISEGRFKAEIVPINVPQKKGDALLVDTDEDAFNLKEDKVGQLKPAFQKDGTVTAANASSINDGAACVILMSREKADALGIKPMAKIVAQKSAAHQPEWFTTAPVTAINQVLAKAKLTTQDIDLWEINEAFAVVTMAAIDELKLDSAKVNVNGGAIALGHPIGASGARILTTLLYAMKSRGAKRGLATLCIGGGEASALIIENI